MKFINFPVDSRSLLLLLFICGTAMHAMEDPSSGESNSDSEMQGADVEKQSPSFFSISKSTKVKLIKAGLSLTYLAVVAGAEWAIWTQWENGCEDYYYCTTKCDGSRRNVDSFMIDCAESRCKGPFEQGPSIVETSCGPSARKIVTAIGSPLILPCLGACFLWAKLIHTLD